MDRVPSRYLAGPFLFLALLALNTAGAVPGGMQPLLSYLRGGSFEPGPGGWALGPGTRIETAPDAPHGKRVLSLTDGAAAQDVLDLLPGRTYTIAVSYRLTGVRATAGRGYAFLALYQQDQFGELSGFRDFLQAEGSTGWRRVSYSFKVAPETRAVSVRCGLFQAEGTLRVDAVTLVEGTRPAGFAEVVEQETVPASLPGLTPSPRGNVALYRDDIPPEGTPSSPEALARALRQAGFGVAFLNSDQLADTHLLNRATFDVLILPYGASFPVRAAESFRRFLRRGGKFLSMGGYAFDNLLEKREGQWRKPPPPPAPPVADARWRYTIPASDLRGKGALTFAGRLRSLNVSGEGFAFLAVYQYDAHGRIVAWKDVCHVTGSQDWAERRYPFLVEDQAETVELHAGLYRCRGVAWADDLRLEDATGKPIVRPALATPWAPDSRAPRTWQRSSPELCTLDPKGSPGGAPALKTRLSYFVPQEERLNTRFGRPGDGLDVAPTQLGVFQPDFRLERAVSLFPSPNQCVLTGTASARVPGPLDGYAAVGVAGFDQARWQPLLDSRDRYGRPRGAAGALLRHYAGPYAGSSWAYFGVTNRDLFAPECLGAEALVAVVDALARDTYLARVSADPPCARLGEEVSLRASVYNGGRQGRRVRVRFSILPEGGGRALFQQETDVAGDPAQSTEAKAKWRMPAGAGGSYRVLCELSEAGRPIDRLESGVVVWSPALVARGPRVSLQGNYLRLDGTPRFLFGTDDWSYIFTQDRETPAQWRLDAAERRDLGVQIYEDLGMGMPATPEAREALFRRRDALIQLAQEHGQIYFAGLLVGANVAADDAELARQAEWCGAFAHRYRDVPGLIYYLNGDLRCQIDARLNGEWNRWLRERYGSDQALRAAWGDGAAGVPPLGEIPVVDSHDGVWEDVRAYDMNLFRACLIRRWTGTLLRAIRAEDPDALTSCEFYQLPHEGIDLPEGIGDLDLGNIGYFDRPLADIRRFPSVLAYSDQRARGKSLGAGEYGVKTHPAWGDGGDYGYHTARTPSQAVDLFLAVGHYALGLGASRVHNWCWKDCTHRVLPWGMVYPGDGVPKPIALAHRNQSLLFRQLQPVYREPQVYVLTPDSHRLGAQKYRVIEGVLRGIALAQGAHVENLGVLNERRIAEEGVPAAAKVLFYPLPYCPSDAAYRKLLDWVRAGGTLYLSGDISYDEYRQRTRTARLEQLCGVRFVTERYPNITYGNGAPLPLSGRDGWRFSPGYPGMRLAVAGAQVLATAPDGSPAAVRNALGRGQVVLLAEPLELHSSAETLDTDVGVYRSVLRLAGAKTLALEPDDPRLHLFRVALTDGGSVWVLFNADESRESREVTLRETKPALTFTLRKQRPALAWFDGRGRLRALGVDGSVTSGGRLLLRGAGHTFAFSTDGADLRASRAVALLPLKPGELRVPAAWRRPEAVVGEVRDGAWRRFEKLPFSLTSGEASLIVSPDAEGSILLAGESDRLAEGEHFLQGLMAR